MNWLRDISREYDVYMKIIGTVALLLLSAMITIVVKGFGG